MVGSEVVGLVVGDTVGAEEVGSTVGETVGLEVGSDDEGGVVVQ